ncbi:MAG TPA: Smr/MutS family protein [Polyangiaceae bacterium LLY-WYZ-15_(1-7)]|nr:hypothetical protein [Sandaracinus sp.]HJL04465.1 Smr/MutS family protein [Polyangiaceae bacterium LLY-WYZ-15_(1-7)]HJL08417.1 Smr/MutS family protein [Polyangiaceae bacterium LLY-WYZ-15_(1-7)]HJL26148.1 Smr/MutS family protein [Polyangiaceae bacterium LLY-WYZ-15_(1-7)]HJL37461.1 Smr/MutS family protein [Polyangiaceae bacterium LLY-WYZ-15_(1-7)]
MAKRDDGKKTTGLNQPFAELARASREAKRKQALEHAKRKGAAAKKASEAVRQRAAAEAARAKQAAAKGAAKGAAKDAAPPSGAAPGGAAPGGAAPSGAKPPEGFMESYSYDDRVAFSQAFGGVRPLDAPPPGGKKRKKAKKPTRAKASRAEAERQAREAAAEEARARLDRLVAGDVDFTVRRDPDGLLEGRRRGEPDRTLRMLLSGELTPEARLDLHGLTKDDAAKAVRRFVRESQRSGRRTVALIHGRGSHSEGGRGVLEEACLEMLTQGGAAPVVDAFCTAPRRHGGAGVMLVRLRAL